MLLMKWLCGRPILPADPALLCVVDVRCHGRSKFAHIPEAELYFSQNSVSTAILNTCKPKKRLEPKMDRDGGVAHLVFKEDANVGRCSTGVGGPGG